MQTLAQLGCEPAVTIRPADSLDVALDRLLESEATELYVTDDVGRLLGIVPDYELLKAQLSGPWSELTAGQLMSNRLLCFTPETLFADVLRVFRESQHSRAAIIEDGRLIGRITRRAVLRALCQNPPSPSAIAPPKFLQAVGAGQFIPSPV